MTDLGTLGGFSIATGVNSTGNVVVGGSDIGGNVIHAFRWTEASNVMTDLGTLGGTSSFANAVNSAGNVVVGESKIGADDRAFRWTEASNTMIDLGTLGGTTASANAVNSAGNVVVGESDIGGNIHHAFRWTEASNAMTDLGTLGGTTSFAHSVNSVGDVVVGKSQLASGADRAFRWTEATGMQSIEQWLAANGVTVTGQNTKDARVVSADGNVVAGVLDNDSAFIARVTSMGSGMINVPEFTAGLQRVANSALLAHNDADLVMHGIHGNPMRSLLPAGRSSIWTSGDVGRQDHGAYDSKLGAAEVGYAHRFNTSAQLNMAVGRTYSSASTGLGGDTTTQSTYVLPELILLLPNTSVFATLSAYYGSGDLRLDRAYLNAGTMTHTYGAPDMKSLGARIRLDWKDAVALGKNKLTPYASLTYMKTRIDEYTEQGNGFPVLWNERTEHATTARIGIDAVRPLNDSINILGRMEAAHRFENTGTTTSGQIIGAGGGPFTFPGQNLMQKWLRVGLGIESKVGNGMTSVMLNATTQGEAPSYWLAANYRWVF
ncbi:autotransporter domain-containing protein [Herminiimonas arsenitoxidans]|uniref:autotransporter domain-containing protein n=1 Tax=Herminiimonas arsenitoxidans TaxID=1809410 RepID=UPI000970B3DE|nr:autotransporter domain-containing protein [Herminiimonas arsenitoxidans]